METSFLYDECISNNACREFFEYNWRNLKEGRCWHDCRYFALRPQTLTEWIMFRRNCPLFQEYEIGLISNSIYLKGLNGFTLSLTFNFLSFLLDPVYFAIAWQTLEAGNLITKSIVLVIL